MKNKDNQVHLHGFLNEVREFEINDKKSFKMDVATVENYKVGDEPKKNYTYHRVGLITDDAKTIKAIRAAMKDIENNKEHAAEADFKPKVHTVSLDGSLVVRENEKDGKLYYNPEVVAEQESFKLDAKLAEGEVRNLAEFKGNIASIDINDEYKFAKINIALHYFVPGESENYKGEVKPYTENTSFAETRVNAKLLPKVFEDLSNGNLAVGDLISVRGQMHNNRYTDSKDTKQNKIVVDLKKVELIAKKGQKKAAAEEKTEKKAEVKKETKKAAPKKAAPRKKGVTM